MIRYTHCMKCFVHQQGCKANATGSATIENVQFALCDVHLAVAKTKKNCPVKRLTTTTTVTASK